MRERATITELGHSLNEAARPISILSHISWPSAVRTEFLAKKGKALPRNITYQAYDNETTTSNLARAKTLIPKISDPIVRSYFERTYESIALSGDLLNACGTKEFFRVSKKLYGSPKSTKIDGVPAPIRLARRIEQLLAHYTDMDLGEPPEACLFASEVQRRMENAVKLFGSRAPKIEISDELSANASATSDRVRIRRTACFSERDARQLVEHEIMIHVVTSLNGKAQEKLPNLFQSHPGTTMTQEGLAVFAELITGTLDFDRFRRLGDRVLAIQMATDGADFCEVYRFYLERIGSEEQAYENTRRVFRGGLVEGGAPFTKDIVYLSGLLRVHNFLRVLVTKGKAEYMPLLFAGKMDIDDLPAIHRLSKMGLCVRPEFLPNWIRDRSFLVAYLGYSSFLNAVDLKRVRVHFEELITGLT